MAKWSSSVLNLTPAWFAGTHTHTHTHTHTVRSSWAIASRLATALKWSVAIDIKKHATRLNERRSFVQSWRQLAAAVIAFSSLSQTLADPSPVRPARQLAVAAGQPNAGRRGVAAPSFRSRFGSWVGKLESAAGALWEVARAPTWRTDGPTDAATNEWMDEWT